MKVKSDNRDPITDAPGAHPVGTGLGATGGAVVGAAAMGAAAGTAAGPVTAAVGGITGAVVGGLLGKAAAESVNPTTEAAYWRESFTSEPYYLTGRPFEDYGPAYELGWSGRVRYVDDFDTVEHYLARDWETRRGGSTLTWDEARPAAQAAWSRVDRYLATEGQDNQNLIDVLNDLIEACRDGEYGFNACAEYLDAGDLKRRLHLRATQSREAAAELAAEVRRLGGQPDEGGTARGAVHRGWVAVRGTLSSHSERAMLEECERGEDVTLTRYRRALREALPSDIRELVSRQLQQVQYSHDDIKRLRDEARSRT